MSKFNSLINNNLINYVKQTNSGISSFKKSSSTRETQITKIENLFIKNVLDKINKQSSLAIKKYLDKIKKKDKDVLKQIDNDAGFNFNLNLMGELELLQKRGYILGATRGLQELRSQFSNELDLASFAKVYDSNLERDDGTLSNTATNLPIRIAKTNDNLDIVSTRDTIENIRYYDVVEKLKTTDNLNKYTNNLFYESREFRDEYLQKRNLNIAQNFTNKYKENIKKQIGDYIDKGTDITREKDLVEILTGQRIKLSPTATQTQIRNRQTQGLTKEVIEDPQAYQDAIQGDLYKFSPNARVERIAKTELPVAYNLGSLNVFLDYGYDTFRIDNDDLVDNCVLCVSLQVKTRDPNNYITLADLASINYNPGSTNFYGIDFRSINTNKRWNELPNNSQRLMAPVFHPNCYCRIIPVKKQSKKKLEENKKQLSNLNKNKSLLGTSLSIANKITTAVTVHNAVVNTLDEISLQQKLKEEENKKNLYKAIIAGTSILSMGAMYFYFYKNYLRTLDENISKQLANTFVQETISPIEKSELAVQIQETISPIPTTILNKTKETLENLNATRKTIQEIESSKVQSQLIPNKTRQQLLSNYKPTTKENLDEFNSLYKQIDQVLKGDLSRVSKQVNDLVANRLTYTPDEFDNLKKNIKKNIDLLLDKTLSLGKKIESLFNILFNNPNISGQKKRQLSTKYIKYRNTINNSVVNKINKLFDKLNYTYNFKTKLYNIVEFKKYE